MDFLKTLLAYLTLLATLGVQEGPLPETVPTPTPLPATMTATPVPHQTEAPTATPSPTPRPVPTITPNYRYDSIDFGDSGSAVRKLQNKLIELGYMPAGSADGSYGYQTYNAVKAFQRANGLSADGVAGPATLTNLYENPNVVGVTPETPVPTATPTPTMPPVFTPTPPPENPLADLGVAKLDGGFIISGNNGSALYIQQVIDGKQALVKPGLWRNADGLAIVALPQLADCLNWLLMGSAADGLYTLQACGYTVSILMTSQGPDVIVDGTAVTLDTDDVILSGGMLYVSSRFLETTLGASTVFDVDENSLVLFLTEKEMALRQD